MASRDMLFLLLLLFSKDRILGLRAYKGLRGRLKHRSMPLIFKNY
jgi:hypothetical protein